MTWTPFGVVHFHINHTKQQILADLIDVLGNDDDLSTANKSMIYGIVDKALMVVGWREEEEADNDKEAAAAAASAGEYDDDDNNNDVDDDNDDDDDNNNEDYVQPLQRPCIRDQLNSSAETKDDYKLLQLEAHNHQWD